MKDLILSTIEVFGKEVCEELKIDMPVIKFEDDLEVPACSRYSYVEDAFLGSLGEVKIIPGNEVAFSIPRIEEQLKQLGFKSDKYISAFVKFLVAHEFRHVWQTIYEPSLITKGMGMFSFSMGGYGERPVEKDANEFAVSLASNKYETKVFKLNKGIQELTDNSLASRSLEKETSLIYLDLRSKEITKASLLKCLVGGVTIAGIGSFLLSKITK